jgi:hypothetical protein
MTRGIHVVATVAAMIALASGFSVPARAGGARESPARSGEVSVRVEPERLVLGGEAPPRAEARVSGVPADVEVTLSASLGGFEGARYRPGDRRAPAWVIVVADADGLRVATRVRLFGGGALPTQTTPRARVTVELGGRRFGPVIADQKGQATIQIEVPPEALSATVIAVDENDFATQREVALPQAEWPRALVVVSPALGVGEEGTVSVYVLDARGGWAEDGPAPELELPPGLTLLSPPARTGEPGRWDARVRVVSTAEQVEVGATVGGERAQAGRMRLLASPTGAGRWRGPGPGERAAPPRALGLQVGRATAFGDPVANAGGVDFAWRILRRPIALSVVGSVLVATGLGHTPITIKANETELTDVDYSVTAVAAGARVRVALPAELGLEIEGGLGLGFGSSTYDRRKPNGNMRLQTLTASDTALLLTFGGGVTRRFGPLEAALMLRWLDLRFAADLEVEGSALGLWFGLDGRILF